MRGVVVAAAVAFACGSTTLSIASVARGLTPQMLDRRMEQFVAKTQIPGVAVAIVWESRPDYTRGFGRRSLVSAQTVDEHTLFKLNSLTKSMTALAIATLVEQGRLSWHDRLIDFLPGFRLSDPWITREVTFEDALSHRVGVEATDWFEDLPQVKLDEAIRRMRYLPQVERFRDTFLYDNFMYSVAGVAAGRLTGDWDRMIRERVFQPLGMADSVTDFTPYVRPDAIAPCHECELENVPAGLDALIEPINIAAGHFRANGVAHVSEWRFSSSRPAGAVWSSAHDMARYLHFYLDRGRAGGTRVLSEKALVELITPRIPATFPGSAREAQRKGAYALGWGVGTYQGHPFMTHGGASIEYQSRAILFPDERIGIAIMANLGDGREGVVDAMAWEIADAFFGLSAGGWVDAALIESDRPRETPPVCGGGPSSESAPLARYVGRYHHEAYGDITVAQRDEQTLLLTQGPGRWGVLRPVSDHCFELRWNGPRPGPEELTFIAAPSGARELRLRHQSFTR